MNKRIRLERAKVLILTTTTTDTMSPPQITHITASILPRGVAGL